MLAAHQAQSAIPVEGRQTAETSSGAEQRISAHFEESGERTSNFGGWTFAPCMP